MQSQLVFGANEFLGLTLCEHFLQEGLPVKGIMLPKTDPVSIKIIDERLMLTGRNALFTTSTFDGNLEIKGDDYQTIYMIGHHINKPQLEAALKVSLENNLSFVFITNLFQDEENESRVFEDMIRKRLEKSQISYSIIRVPTLFGSWSPESSKEQVRILVKAYPYIMVVEDAAETIVHLSKKKKSTVINLFADYEKDPEIQSWDVEQFDANRLNNEEYYVLSNPTSIKEAITIQKEIEERFALLHE
ncbi:hypothetical protein [Metabacillus arenae]|uniref:NAD(P)-dependent oxidoreductase n=1 Tax=Metabacillus arenae TaxID=2771434 RepID=A0A926NL95_9BACI|nr:hypothetical protein [Metabacillus arenae]MBD1383456.1 hypothetical protein [Metabacillus arenae]